MKHILFIIFISLLSATAYAQSNQTSSQTMAKMFEEMQVLKLELGELRNMVEEQRYQIEKLKLGSDGKNLVHERKARVGQKSNSLRVSEKTTVADTAGVSRSSNYNDVNSVVDEVEKETQAVNDNNGNDEAVTVSNNESTVATDSVEVIERTISAPPLSNRKNSTEEDITVEERETLVDQDRIFETNKAVQPRSDEVDNQVLDNASKGDEQNAEAPVETSDEIVPVIAVPSDDNQSNEDSKDMSMPSKVVLPSEDIESSELGQPDNQQDNREVSASFAKTRLSEDELYQQGFDYLKQSNHKKAIEIFKQHIALFPKGELVDSAHYWIAESNYVNKELLVAKDYFNRIIDVYPNSARVPDAMLKVAYIEQESNNITKVRIMLQEIVQYHPRSNAAISARNRLKVLK